MIVQSDIADDLVLFIGHCDLYFMVHGFCLVSLTISKASYFGYLFSLTQRE